MSVSPSREGGGDNRAAGRGRGRGRGRGGRGRGRGRGPGRGRDGRQDRSDVSKDASLDHTSSAPHQLHSDSKLPDSSLQKSLEQTRVTSPPPTMKSPPSNGHHDDSMGKSEGDGPDRAVNGRGRFSGRGRGRGRRGDRPPARGGRGGRGRGRYSRSRSPMDERQQAVGQHAHDEVEGGEEEASKHAAVEHDIVADGPLESTAQSLESPAQVPSEPPPSSLAPTSESATKPTFLNLPPPSAAFKNAGKSRRPAGVPMILSRSTVPQPEPDPEAHLQHLSERLAEAALSEDDQQPKTEDAVKKKQPKKSGHKKGKKAETPPPEPVEEISTTDALRALPAQEVSITASSQVKMRKDESTADSLAESTPTAPNKISTKSRNKKKKGVLKTEFSQKAARKFNTEVRNCVERGDPVAMRELLYDKNNHSFALDASTLETVLKALVVAAMFEDALYCLRNCTFPETLSVFQAASILTCLPQNLRNSSAYTAADMINQLCIATKFDGSRRTYFLRIVRGVALEFLEEATSARDRICSSPCERLVRSALCIVNVTLKRSKKKPADIIVMPGDQLGVFLPDTAENRGIQAGDAVSLLPYAGPYPMSAESLDRNMIEASVTNTNPMILRLQERTNTDLYSMLTEEVEGNLYRIDKLANRMGFNRQLSAAVAMASADGPCPQLIQAITAMDENIDFGKRRRGEITSTAALCNTAIPWSADEEDGADQDALRASARLALEKYGALEGLNASQQLAVEGAVTNRLTLVQGPPGTGKTAVAIRILQHWARLAAANAPKGENPAPVLATSDSNIAVDNLVEGCAAVGLRVVRLGRPEAIRPELLRYCIDRPPSNGARESQPFSSPPSASHFKDRMKQLKSAQVVCCTCIGSGGDILDALGPLERVLVDEATQATEPAIIVPLMRGCRQLVLVGDHCQLPPTVLSTKAEEEGHGVPLFSRMVACGVPPFMLDTQYRMHPCIAMFPSDLFYGGLLKNGVSAPERRPLAGFPWPREEFPVAFMPVQGIEMDDGVSKYNQDEAETACRAVQLLLEGGQCGVADIAVVTPYAAQARLIRRMLRGLQQHTGPPYIEVSSVDGFQGREKEAVVFSAVRSNDYGAIGFTSDWRRVNVSFTRARRALVVIGNDQTLRRGDPETWGSWLAWADAHGINMDRPGQPRGRYDAEQLRRVRGGTTAAEMLKDVLERQQAQLKNAEKQQERAVRNAEGHIIATVGKEENGAIPDTPKQLTLEQDLALMENTEGNWDDSDNEDEKVLQHSVSKATLTSSVASSSDLKNGTRSSTPVDAWDL